MQALSEKERRSKHDDLAVEAGNVVLPNPQLVFFPRRVLPSKGWEGPYQDGIVTRRNLSGVVVWLQTPNLKVGGSSPSAASRQGEAKL